MSEHPLPEDPADWPKNCYDLLGVTGGMQPRDLRRAYNRLIRIYKPEQYPEQFRRIREAYESLLRMAEWFGNFEEAPTESPSVSEPEIQPVEIDAPEHLGPPR
jgi:DnaJ domain